jgi:peptidoglycan/LPS O-acetylase OafA/YrhL
VLFGATVASPAQLVQLRGDGLAAMFYVANWRFIAVDASYAELFAAPSPVLHFWSLAIEEQFYVLFPLLVAGVFALGRGSRRVLAGVLGAATVGSVAYMAVLVSSSVDAAYYNTFSRSAELLIGALLAMAVAVPRVRRTLASAPAQRGVLVAGGLALAATVVLWGTAAQTDEWLYRGGLAGYALLSAVLIVAAVQEGPLRAVLSWSALRALGRISYGVYLFHWPIFLWLTPARTGLELWPLFGLRLIVTLALAIASYVLLEQPIRSGRRLKGWHPFVAAPLAVVIVLVGLFRVTADPPTEEVVSFEPTEEPEAPVFDAAEVVEAPPPPTTAPPELALYEVPPAPPLPEPPALAPGQAPRLYVAGDSAAFTLGGGLYDWSVQTGEARVWNRAKLGCGVGRGGIRSHIGRLNFPESYCPQVQDAWYADMAELRPHVVMLMFGIWDISDRLLEGDDEWRSIGDPVYDQYLRREISTAIDVLQGQGATVVLVTHPTVRSGLTEGLAGSFPENQPDRVRRLNELIEEVSATRPRSVVLDLRAHMGARPEGELDLQERPDGIHWTPASSRAMAEWLGPNLLAIARGEPLPPGTLTTPG